MGEEDNEIYPILGNFTLNTIQPLKYLCNEIYFISKSGL